MYMSVVFRWMFDMCLFVCACVWVCTSVIVWICVFCMCCMYVYTLICTYVLCCAIEGKYFQNFHVLKVPKFATLKLNFEKHSRLQFFLTSIMEWYIMLMQIIWRVSTGADPGFFQGGVSEQWLCISYIIYILQLFTLLF